MGFLYINIIPLNVHPRPRVAQRSIVSSGIPIGLRIPPPPPPPPTTPLLEGVSSSSPGSLFTNGDSISSGPAKGILSGLGEGLRILVAGTARVQSTVKVSKNLRVSINLPINKAVPERGV